VFAFFGIAMINDKTKIAKMQPKPSGGVTVHHKYICKGLAVA
jgi:hypothetical protein